MAAVEMEKTKVGVGVNVVVGVGVIVDVRVGVMVAGMELAVCVCAARAVPAITTSKVWRISASDGGCAVEIAPDWPQASVKIIKTKPAQLIAQQLDFIFLLITPSETRVQQFSI